MSNVQVELDLLGPVMVRDGSRPVSMGPKSAALLAWLAVAGSSSRERLLGLFWPESPQKQAQGSLRYALHTLRQALPTAIRADATTADLDREVVRVDLDELRQARTASQRAAASRLRRGVFCEGVTVSDSPEIDDWLAEQRARWDEFAIENLLGLATLLHPDEGLKPARQAVALDPLREESHRVLIRLLLRKGDRAEARRALQACQERLWEGLGVEPSPETLALLDAPAEPTGPRTNLPLDLRPLIGRDEVAVAVTDLFSSHRLVTLLGEGGVGKTRLAVHVASRLQPVPRDGVWMVDLASLRSPDEVERHVASVVGVRDGAPLASELASRHMLLLLDNCEHVLERCARLVHALLGACPGITILATSREPLKVAGEHAWLLDPLPCPPAGHPHCEQFAAFRLFCERAAEVGAPIDASGDAEAVAEICRRLDGLPLALELAASRTRVLAPRQIAERLDSRFRLLQGGCRTALPRQQTLRGLIDWSYQLLEPEEQRVFRLVSVFQGGFTLEAAGTLAGLDDWDMLDILTRLVEKSLVRTEPRGGGLRYRMLESLQEFARERLDEQGETAPALARHLAIFSDLARAVCPLTKGEKQRLWLDRLDDEVDNFRAALSGALESEPEAALSLAANLCPLWKDRDYRTEGRRYLDLALTRTGESIERARALRLRGEIELQQGECERALDSLAAGLEVARRLDARNVALECLKARGAALLALQRTDEARATLEEALQGLLDLGDAAEAAACRNALGTVILHQGDATTARPHFETSLAWYREQRSPKAVGMILANLGHVALAQGDLATAARCFEESLGHLDRVGALWNAASCLEGMAGLRLEQGLPLEAVRMLGVATRVRAELETPRSPLEAESCARIAARVQDAVGSAWDAAWKEARLLAPADLLR